MNRPKARIKDIAVMAGVSEGTVDRVLHNRGEVSEKSRKAVTEVLEKINYSPNILARSLASKKQYRFIAMIPEFQKGEYWDSIANGFDAALQDFKEYHVHIEKKHFNQYDNASFIDIANETLAQKPDAVCMAPIFRNETIDFTKELRKRGIPFSFIDSMIEDTGFLTYYGQNSFQSGYVAAKLLFETLPSGSRIIVIRTRRKGSVSNQTDKRYNGFRQFIKDNNLENDAQLINFEINNEDEELNQYALQEIFEEHQNIKAAIIFNSKVYKFARYLEKIGKKGLNVIGYDLLDENVTLLREGVVDKLIAQRPEKQAYNSIHNLCKKLIFNQEVIQINYVPIDILIKENIDYYLPTIRSLEFTV
jgi:LacI family transcriptional regulator